MINNKTNTNQKTDMKAYGIYNTHLSLIAEMTGVIRDAKNILPDGWLHRVGNKYHDSDAYELKYSIGENLQALLDELIMIEVALKDAKGDYFIKDSYFADGISQIDLDIQKLGHEELAQILIEGVTKYKLAKGQEKLGILNNYSNMATAIAIPFEKMKNTAVAIVTKNKEMQTRNSEVAADGIKAMSAPYRAHLANTIVSNMFKSELHHLSHDNNMLQQRNYINLKANLSTLYEQRIWMTNTIKAMGKIKMDFQAAYNYINHVTQTQKNQLNSGGTSQLTQYDINKLEKLCVRLRAKKDKYCQELAKTVTALKAIEEKHNQVVETMAARAKRYTSTTQAMLAGFKIYVDRKNDMVGKKSDSGYSTALAHSAKYGNDNKKPQKAFIQLFVLSKLKRAAIYRNKSWNIFNYGKNTPNAVMKKFNHMEYSTIEAIKKLGPSVLKRTDVKIYTFMAATLNNVLRKMEKSSGAPRRDYLTDWAKYAFLSYAATFDANSPYAINEVEYQSTLDRLVKLSDADFKSFIKICDTSDYVKATVNISSLLDKHQVTSTAVSSNSSKTSRHRASRPSAKINRKGLFLSKQPLKNSILLPKHYSLGTAINDGGCFFDSLAQALNTLKKTNQYTEKVLREKCHAYYCAHKQEVDGWNKKDCRGIDMGNDYHFVQYTKKELDKDFNQKTPVWGRPHVEGVMLCRQLNLTSLYVIELIKDPDNNKNLIRNCLRISPYGVKSLGEDSTSIDFSQTPCLVVLQGSLHFVPILPDKHSAINGQMNEATVEAQQTTKKLMTRKPQPKTPSVAQYGMFSQRPQRALAQTRTNNRVKINPSANSVSVSMGDSEEDLVSEQSLSSRLNQVLPYAAAAGFVVGAGAVYAYTYYNDWLIDTATSCLSSLGMEVFMNMPTP